MTDAQMRFCQSIGIEIRKYNDDPFLSTRMYDVLDMLHKYVVS